MAKQAQPEQPQQQPMAQTNVAAINQPQNHALEKASNDIGSKIIARVDALCETGLTFPEDYNYVNAIKASVLTLQTVVDRNKRPALEVCTPASVQTALFEMVTKGLDVSKKQAYFIVRGTQLCLQPSYFGNILAVKRLFPNWDPVARTIREGDAFEYAIDPNTGKAKLIRHEQAIENLDKPFVGGYVFLPCKDGGTELYIMTAKQIKTAWAKSQSTTQTTHKEFDEKMAIKTLYNSGCTKVINSYPKDSGSQPYEEDNEPVTEDASFEDLTEHHTIPENLNPAPAPTHAPEEKINPNDYTF